MSNVYCQIACRLAEASPASAPTEASHGSAFWGWPDTHGSEGGMGMWVPVKAKLVDFNAEDWFIVLTEGAF